jgi:hypothetical protein
LNKKTNERKCKRINWKKKQIKKGIKKEQLKEWELNLKKMKWNVEGQNWKKNTNQEKDWKIIIKRMSTIFDIKTKKSNGKGWNWKIKSKKDSKTNKHQSKDKIA